MKKTCGIKSLKKGIAALCVLGLALGMTACAQNSGSTTAAETTAAPESTAVETETETAAEPVAVEPTYSLVQNVYNWGSSYSKVIIPVSDPAAIEYLDADSYTVAVSRADQEGQPIGSGSRTVTAAYRSDEQGNEAVDGGYVTLVMGVGASSSLASPYYNLMTGLKAWANCSYTVENTVTGDTWNQLDTVYHPDEEGFTTGNVYEGVNKTIPYASYEPEADSEKHPLIVWLHGFGSGGTDIGFVTGGMMVTNFITPEIQDIFGGAYVLLPQADTMWLESPAGGFSVTTDGSSIFTEDLMGLIEDYISKNPGVDSNRIYLGGCSNGGYMTMALAISYPDYFAALFPVCEAYYDVWITDEQIDSIKDIPTWFVHCLNDPTVDVTVTAVPTYERLLEAGAGNLHFTTYESISDPEYGNAYTGHFAWVYSLLNMCSTDFDGEPVTVDGNEVTIYEWMSMQSR